MPTTPEPALHSLVILCAFMYDIKYYLYPGKKKRISSNQKPHYNPLPSPSPFLRGYILGFHSQRPPYHLPASFHMEKSRRRLSRQRWAGFTVGSDSLPVPQSTPAPGKRNGRGAAAERGERASPSPGGHQLGLWTCRSPPLPACVRDGGRGSVPREIAGLELSRQGPFQRAALW